MFNAAISRALSDSAPGPAVQRSIMQVGLKASLQIKAWLLYVKLKGLME